jgi:hypothetical protein
MAARNPLKAWFHRCVLRRYGLCFIAMGISFFAFGIGTLNLIHTFQANAELLLTHGAQALWDGGLMQLVEILITGYASLLAYIVFKACEYRLVHGLADGL